MVINHGLRNFIYMSNIITRQATAADVTAIYRFVNELEDTVFDEKLFTEYYYRNLQLPNTHYLVAIEAGAILGYISCHGQILLHHCGLVYEIQEMFVDKEHRSKGIGALLLKALEEKISGDGYTLLEVSSNIKRKDTHRFYLSNGFSETHFKFTKDSA